MSEPTGVLSSLLTFFRQNVNVSHPKQGVFRCTTTDRRPNQRMFRQGDAQRLAFIVGMNASMAHVAKGPPLRLLHAKVHMIAF